MCIIFSKHNVLSNRRYLNDLILEEDLRFFPQSISTDVQYVILKKYFSYPSISSYYLLTLLIKLKLQVDETLLIEPLGTIKLCNQS
jgi:hypothetical protein